jgi:nucleoside-diphosphate-sugar epimerase
LASWRLLVQPQLALSLRRWFSGVGEDLTIPDLAALVARIVGYGGSILFDPSLPDGTPRKLLDVSPIHALGWHAQIPLERGIAPTYEWYLKQTFNLASAAKSHAGGSAAIA